LALLAVSDSSPETPRAAPPLMIVTSPWGPELMLMVAGLEGKMLATPVAPLVIEIGPGGANADSVSIVRWPPGSLYEGASIPSPPGTVIMVLPTTVTGLFDKFTSTVLPMVPGPTMVCAFAPLAVARTSSAASRTAFRAPDCP
jgi:hypothetical protein